MLLAAQDMPGPPEKFGNKIVAFHYFTRPGSYMLVVEAQSSEEIVTSLFFLKVLELPVSIYTNPDGPFEAGQQVQLEVRVGGDSFLESNIAYDVEAVLVSSDLMHVTRSHLSLSADRQPGILHGMVFFPSAGLYYVAVDGLLQTDLQTIHFARNFTIQVALAADVHAITNLWLHLWMALSPCLVTFRFSERPRSLAHMNLSSLHPF